MQAIHGGKAPHGTIDSHTRASLLRGGMRPKADGYPAAMRATRDLRRRRTPLMRQRAALLAPVQHTTSQSDPPAIGQQIAYTANREGGAARFADPALQQTMAIDLELITSDAQRRSDLERLLLKTAKHHEAQPLSR
jgi:hypothetical protein